MPATCVRTLLAVAIVALGLVSWIGSARAQCTRDADCRTGRVCREGRCSKSKCTTDIDCPNGQICEAEACVDRAALTAAPSASASRPTAASPPIAASESAASPTLASSPIAAPTPVSPDATPPAAIAPPALRYERESIRPLWITGLATFASAYLVSIPAAAAIAGATGSEKPAAHAGIMCIPLAGPWLELAGVVEKESSNGAPGLVVVGFFQTAGAVMTIVGLSVRRDVAMAAGLPTIDVGRIGDSGWGARLAGALW